MKIEWKNWDVLKRLEAVNLYLDTVVEQLPVMFVKTGRGLKICITVPEDAIEQVVSSSRTQDRLMMEPRIFNHIVIGRIWQEENEDKPKYWSLLNDKKLQAFVDKTVNHFSLLISKYSQWDSFTSFLRHDINYDPLEKDPLKQVPLEYWWLTGKIGKGSPCHKIPLYENVGVYVDPETGILPVFSGSLYAGMASVTSGSTNNTSLIPQKIPCLGCWLYGMFMETKRGLIRDVCLNDQWIFDCKIKEGIGGYFFLNDDQFKYALIGCVDSGFGPVWGEKRWDTHNKWFDYS